MSEENEIVELRKLLSEIRSLVDHGIQERNHQDYAGASGHLLAIRDLLA
jgi:hypothetical protein